jgi:transposase
MPKSRPPYPPEYRRKIVALVRAGRDPHELASEFECSAQTIRNWVAQAEADAGKRDDVLTDQQRARGAAQASPGEQAHERGG